VLTRLLAMLAAWAVTALLLWWPRLAGPARRKLALLSSGAGLLSLVLALSAEGFRESPTVAVFLLGTPYVMEKASASASLPYYVLTGVFLALGFLGLALGDREAGAIARHWLSSAIGLSLLVTALRFALEKVAAPPGLTYGVGVIWIAPVVGAYFMASLWPARQDLRAVVLPLVVYAYAVRGALALLMVAATRLHLGSHYDVTPLVLVRSPFTGRSYGFLPGSLEQLVGVALLPQLVFWPIYTVLAGVLGALVARLLLVAWSNPAVRVPPEAPRHAEALSD
jgi:hypothetical protein